MDTIQIITLAFPLILGILMFGLGLSLTGQDFLNIKKSPIPILVGLLIQMIICPLFAFGIVHLFQFSPIISIGFMLLAASPGGTTANIFSLLAKGDVALNITLTAINTLLSTAFIPVVVYSSYIHFMGDGIIMPIPIVKITQILMVILIPIFFGMIARKNSLEFAKKSEPWVRKLAILFIALLAVIGLVKERTTLMATGLSILFAVIIFNIGNLLIAYFISKFSKLPRGQAIAIIFEVGVHNCILSMAIAMSPDLLNNTEMAMPAVFYSIFMYISAAVVIKIFAAQRLT